MSCHQTSLDARKCTMVICKMGGEFMNTGASRIRNNTVHDERLVRFTELFANEALLYDFNANDDA